MIRDAFKTELTPGCEAEYQKRHVEICPELSQVLTAAGVSDYSIFLDAETLTLLASWKPTDENTTADLPNHPMVKKWWAFMADIIKTLPDNSPVAVPLNEVFTWLN